METQCQYLKITQHNEFLKLLYKFKIFFDETIVTWKTDTVDFELKEDVEPILSRPYPVPKVYEEMFKNKVERLFLLGVLEVVNGSEWGDSSFAQLKPKSNRVHLLSYFRNPNKHLKQKSYPMPKTNDMSLKVEVFQYVTSLDFNMGYYHIRLSENASNLCTLIVPWRKYCYRRLPSRVANSSKKFKQKVNDIFHGFEFICAYIDEMFI